ncbi:MAG: endonuclease Q family protein [Candidatus Micrarchaeia archaeon]
MEYIADLHLHSRYSRACSTEISIRSLDLAAHTKGIDILGTGDFTSPQWLSEIKSNLTETEDGLYKLKSGGFGTRFVVSVEVSNIFERNGKTRKVHICILAPSISTAENINDVLSKYGNLESDGRPTLNLDIISMVEMLYEIDDKVVIFPAHAWTPFFSVFGSFFGFDSMKEAFEDQAKRVHALETGLSSDPPMNWRVSELDSYTLVSNSDAHSLPNLGREANVFDFGSPSYDALKSAIEKKDSNRFRMTVEFYPEEGKYHYDGHRNCGVSLSPKEALRYNNRCPVCGKKLTIGVLHRVDMLADRPEGYIPDNAIPYVHAEPLQEVIAYVSKKGKTSNYVKEMYSKFIGKFGNEFNATLKSSIEDIRDIDKDMAEAIENIRSGNVNLIPGYDGVFGIVDIMNRVRKPSKGEQRNITDF